MRMGDHSCLHDVDTGDVPEGLGAAGIGVVHHHGAELLDVTPVPQLTLAGPHPPGGVHLEKWLRCRSGSGSGRITLVTSAQALFLRRNSTACLVLVKPCTESATTKGTWESVYLRVTPIFIPFTTSCVMLGTWRRREYDQVST